MSDLVGNTEDRFSHVAARLRCNKVSFSCKLIDIRSTGCELMSPGCLPKAFYQTFFFWTKTFIAFNCTRFKENNKMKI